MGWLSQQIAAMTQDELGTPYGVALTSMYGQERDRKARIARLVVESGVDEKERPGHGGADAHAR